MPGRVMMSHHLSYHTMPVSLSWMDEVDLRSKEMLPVLIS